MGLDKPLQTVVVVFFFGCSSPPPIPKAIIQLMQTTNCDRSKWSREPTITGSLLHTDISNTSSSNQH